jgi:hypothetical protein
MKYFLFIVVSFICTQNLFSIAKEEIIESDEIISKYWEFQDEKQKVVENDSRYKYLSISNEIIYNGLKNNLSFSRYERMRKFKIISKDYDGYPVFNKIYYNNDKDKKDLCIISYVSLNNYYINSMLKLEKKLKKVNFNGHFLYRIGGWPDAKRDGLQHISTPYAFKQCMFEEAYQLGYRKIIWLDSICEPLNDLSEVFKYVENNGCLFIPAKYHFQVCLNELIIDAMNLSIDEQQSFQHYNARIIGLDLSGEKAMRYYLKWKSLLNKKTPYFSFFPEQIPMSVLINRMNLKDCVCHNLIEPYKSHLKLGLKRKLIVKKTRLKFFLRRIFNNKKPLKFLLNFIKNKYFKEKKIINKEELSPSFKI